MKDMTPKEEGLNLLDFINTSHSSFHAVENMVKMLQAAGFKELRLQDKWDICDGGLYMVRYNGSALVAFCAHKDVEHEGFRMIASHSDSPTFRIKPNGTNFICGAMSRLSTETYGGAILYSWTDRPLSFAGRVALRSANSLQPDIRLIDFEKPLGVIPSVAIHFNRGVNEGAAFNKQADMQVLAQAGPLTGMESSNISEELSKKLGVDGRDILDFDLYAYDTTPGCLAGFDDSLILSPKQDNLTMAYESVMAFTDTLDSNTSRIVIVMDNEEVGSGTKQGAGSPVVRDIVSRICEKLNLGEEGFQRAVYNSFLVSADMAHAVHPNHSELSDPLNRPILNGGPVIKYNANQKYMTDADGAAVFRMVCDKAGVPCQTFVNRSDMAGGSTLGNIMTSQLPLRGVDVGNPLLAMHSSRETGGTSDALYLRKALRTFLTA